MISVAVRGMGISGMVRGEGGLLAMEKITGLLLVVATKIPAIIHRLQILITSSSVKSASTWCECFQDG